MKLTNSIIASKELDLSKSAPAARTAGLSNDSVSYQLPSSGETGFTST